MAAFDYDYDVGSFQNRNLQVTRYRQNIQRYRDYGAFGDVSAPTAEGRLKQGMSPGRSQFSAPSAGVQAQFNRGEEIRNPNQPPLDLRNISNLLTNRLYMDYELESRGLRQGQQGGQSQQPQRRMSRKQRRAAEAFRVQREQKRSEWAPQQAEARRAQGPTQPMNVPFKPTVTQRPPAMQYTRSGERPQPAPRPLSAAAQAWMSGGKAEQEQRRKMYPPTLPRLQSPFQG